LRPRAALFPYTTLFRSLVLALERAVVTLVEAPRPLHGDPVAVRRVEREVRRRDGAAQERGVHDVGRDAGLGEELTAALRLLGPLLRQGDVHPAGEQVLGVPFALAVAEQHEGVGHGSILPHRPAPGHGRPTWW